MGEQAGGAAGAWEPLAWGYLRVEWSSAASGFCWGRMERGLEPEVFLIGLSRVCSGEEQLLFKPVGKKSIFSFCSWFQV